MHNHAHEITATSMLGEELLNGVGVAGIR